MGSEDSKIVNVVALVVAVVIAASVRVLPRNLLFWAAILSACVFFLMTR